jgi:regulatory protein
MAITITRIDPQKKNKNRFSLYAGETFVAGLSAETILHHNLHAGDSISTALLEEIKNSELNISIREQAYRFLARRAHSVRELREKLMKKGFEPKLISAILAELKHKNYLNDQDYARLLVKDEIQLRRSGPLLLKQKLMSKGIESNAIDELLDKTYSEEKQIQNCRYLARKKLSTLAKKPALKQKQMLCLYLKNKGFHWETIQTMAAELLQED